MDSMNRFLVTVKWKCISDYVTTFFSILFKVDITNIIAILLIYNTQID